MNGMGKVAVAAILIAVGVDAAGMPSVIFDFAAEQGAVKPLHGVNNAPVRPNGKQD